MSLHSVNFVTVIITKLVHPKQAIVCIVFEDISANAAKHISVPEF